MEELFDIAQYDTYKEDNRREVKKATGGVNATLILDHSDTEKVYH